MAKRPNFTEARASIYIAPDEEFIQYLRNIAEDLYESGMHATADDYTEAARRIEDNSCST